MCRDRGSLCRDMVLRLQAVAWSRHTISCRDSALFLCRDDVAIEVSLSRPRRPRQEVRCCTFCVATGLVWQGFLCRDRVILCRDKFWSRPRVSMSPQSISVSRHSLVLAKDFLLRQSVFMP